MYGGIQSNKFECEDESGCVMYGYWNTDLNGKNLNSVGDDFAFNAFSSDYLIADFKGHEDPDTITISGVYKDQISVPEGENVVRIEYNYPTFGGTATKQINVTLSGRSYGEVEGWVRTAIANTQLEKEQWGKTPIFID